MMKHLINRAVTITAIVAAGAFVAGCAALGGGGAAEVTVAPSSVLVEQVDTRPGDFSWENFETEGFRVTGTAASAALIELQAIQLRDGAQEASISSPVVEVSVEELEAGVPGNEWVPGNSWFPGSKWFPGSQWNPTALHAEELGVVAPDDQAVADAALSELGSGAGGVIIYARGPGVDGTRPLAVTLQEEVTEDLTVRPSTSLQNLGPSDFTWGYFEDQIIVTGTADTNVVAELRAVQVTAGDVADSAASALAVTTPEELEAGVPGSDWIPSTNWVPGDEWFPGSSWDPQAYVTDNTGTATPSRSAVVDAVLPGLRETYSDSVNAVIVYAAGEHLDTVSPFAVVMQQQ